MEHRLPTTESIVKEAQDGEYAVPEFQRRFVWTPSQVRDFADSLSRDFPVGSLLTWKSDTAIQRGDSNETERKSWLIDGQQRTTALRTLFGRRPEWWDDKQGRVWDEHLAAYDIRIDISRAELEFVTRRTGGSRFIRVRDILREENLYRLAESLIAGGNSFTDDVGILAKHLEQVAQIKQSLIPIIEIDDNIELTEVAEIFKRLNSTGTPVQQADIYLGVVAALNPGWVNQQFLKFMYSLDRDGFDIDPAFLFRSFTAIGARKVRFKDIDRKFWHDIDENNAWDQTKKAMQSVCQGLREYGIVNADLALSLNAVVAAATYRAKFPQGSFGPILSWMLRAIRDGFFQGLTETKLDRVITAVEAANSANLAIDNLDALLIGPEEFTAEEFRETTTNRNSVHRLMVYLLAHKNDAEDWDTDGYRIRAEATGDYRPEWHHIFPRKWLTDNIEEIDRRDVDTVANMAVISGRANRRIAARAPREYIADLKLDARGLLAQQAIPDPSFVAHDQYLEWLDSRAERLAAESNRYLRELRKQT